MEKKNIFDDIILWDENEIYSTRFNSSVNKFTNRKANIIKKFNYIIDFLKKCKYNDLVLIVNKNMYIKNNFYKNIKLLKLNDKFQIMQLGIDSPNITSNDKFPKIFSIGSFIINLNKVDFDKFTWNFESRYLNEIYSSSIAYFLHPMRFKKYFTLRIKEIIDNYVSLRKSNINFIEYLKELKNVTNPLIDKNNPFHFLNQVKVSKSLSKFEDRIKSVYNLTKYENKFDDCLFFGLYNIEDVHFLENHKGKKYILWGGSDIDKTLPHHSDLLRVIENIRVDGHFSISKNIKKRLDNLGFKSKMIKFNLVDKKLFFKRNIIGSKIYIYNGDKTGRENIYGKKYYEEIENRFPEIDFIHSVNLNKKYEEMPDVYGECFMGLRLTLNDGNANTVQEMGAMDLPVIHNGEEKNSLSWSNVDEIELKIRYRNIDLFMDSIKSFKKILFICSDYPSYGGAATNCMKIIEYFRSKGKNVSGIFYTNDKVKLNLDLGKNIFVIRKSQLIKKIFEFDVDLIILRNYLEFDLSKILNTTIYFLIPGIFRPNLDKYYFEIKRKKEMDKYIHKNILKTIRFSDKSFCASNHTKNILETFYGLKTKILYFNYIPFYNKFIDNYNDFDNREYEYGIIVSNFDRKVKNLKNIIDELKLNNRKKILIGKNSLAYKSNNITSVDLISNDKIKEYYKKIKYIIQDSFYESCSNVYVESRFYGCKFINLSKLKQINVQENSKYKIKFTSNYNIRNLDEKSLNYANNYIYDLINSAETYNLKIRNECKKTFKILYFINIEYLIRKMSRVRFHAIEKLIGFQNIELYFTGPGWYNYDNTISFELNLKKMNIDFDYLILYKPLDEINNINKDTFKNLKYPICIRYNEMWDEEWTKNEIDLSCSNLIICHHKNDYDKYIKIYNNDKSKIFVYNPHHANPDIFYDNPNIEKEYDILLAGKSTIKHYPLRFRLYNLIHKNINKKLKKFKILVQKHPGYNNNYAYNSQALKDYATNINKCYLCIGGTSKYNYRLGKYVEIAMSGSIILGDLPYEDKFRINKFTVEVNMQMTDNEILDKIIYYLNDKEKLNKMIEYGKEWADEYVTENYNYKLYRNLIQTSDYFKNQ